MSRKIDMTGWVMKEHGVPDSKLIIISEDNTKKSNKGEIYWNCQCECGNIISIKGTRIRSGNTKSCGKCRAENLIGWKIWEHGVPDSRWEVIGREPFNDADGAPVWICRCSCGEIRKLNRYTLLSGASKSCGCLQREVLIKYNMQRGTPINPGDKFGKLTAIKDLGLMPYGANQTRYTLCQCDCGSKPFPCRNEILLCGDLKSCGCMRSSGECYIKALLNQNNIQYKTEYIFSDLVSENNYPLRFDFAIFDNNSNLSFLIEYDGKQHFYADGGWNTEEYFQITHARDLKKNEYCKNHNIILKRIPYFIEQNFTIDDIYSDKYNI